MQVTETPAVIPGRALAAGEGMAWIGEGWRLFLKAPLMWILAVLVILVLEVVLGFVPLLGQIASFLIKPVFFAGLMIACRSLDSGGDFELEHVFAGFTHRFGNLVILGIVLFAFTVGIFAVTIGFFALTVGLTAFTHGLDDLGAALATAAPFVLATGLIMLALFLPLIMAYWFAPALIALNGVSPGEAMKASLGASLRNFVPFLLYGIVMLVLAVVACIPFGLGLLVWVPLALTSTYAAYKGIFTASAPAPAAAAPVTA
jgi:uncharacterized membrane protein